MFLQQRMRGFRCACFGAGLALVHLKALVSINNDQLAIINGLVGSIKTAG